MTISNAIRLTYLRLSKIPLLLSDIACDVHELVGWFRRLDERELTKTVGVSWYGKRVGESSWRSECEYRTVRLGETYIFELTTHGYRIEAGSSVSVFGGFAKNATLGITMVGGGQCFSIPEFVEAGTSLKIEVVPL